MTDTPEADAGHEDGDEDDAVDDEDAFPAAEEPAHQQH